MKEWLTIGRKIVCVNDDPRFIIPFTIHSHMHGLTKDQIYTIRDFGPDLWLPKHIVVWLEEIIRPICQIRGDEVGYHVDRFRPLLTRKTNISAFTKLLKTKSKELEDA